MQRWPAGGYLRARTPVTPDDWYFDGHFKNDPCMPGTLMFEGCFQALSVYPAGKTWKDSYAKLVQLFVALHNGNLSPAALFELAYNYYLPVFENLIL